MPLEALDRPSAETRPPKAVAPPKRLPLLVLEGMRPRQWSKNAFVFAGIVFAGKVLHPDALLHAAIAFVAFCLVSGATYLFNDVRDMDTDRLSPRTAGRPIARGDLSPHAALVAAGLATLAGLGLAAADNLLTLAAVGGYLVLQIAYSTVLKHMLFLDVMAIAGGFVIRAYAGGVAIDVPVSPWLLLCTGVLALFLGLAKRRGELVGVTNGSRPARAVLEQYTVPLLDELIAVVTPATLVVYCIYAVLGAKSDAMLLTVPFVVYGIFRVLYIVHYQPSDAEEPSEAVFRDAPLFVCVLLWGITSAIVILVS
jgi:4-hydroxybenzoate polyprenyltransferase